MALSEKVTAEIEDAVFIRCMKQLIEQLELGFKRKYKEKKEEQYEEELKNIFVPEAGQSQAEYLETSYMEMPEDFNPEYQWDGEPGDSEVVSGESSKESFVEFKEFSNVSVASSNDAMADVLILLNIWRKSKKIKILGMQWDSGVYQASTTSSAGSRNRYQVSVGIMYIMED